MTRLIATTCPPPVATTSATGCRVCAWAAGRIPTSGLSSWGEPIWSEVKRVIQNPDVIVDCIDTSDTQGSGSLEEEIAQAKRDLRSI